MQRQTHVPLLHPWRVGRGGASASRECTPPRPACRLRCDHATLLLVSICIGLTAQWQRTICRRGRLVRSGHHRDLSDLLVPTRFLRREASSCCRAPSAGRKTQVKTRMMAAGAHLCRDGVGGGCGGWEVVHRAWRGESSAVHWSFIDASCKRCLTAYCACCFFCQEAQRAPGNGANPNFRPQIGFPDILGGAGG